MTSCSARSTKRTTARAVSLPAVPLPADSAAQKIPPRAAILPPLTASAVPALLPLPLPPLTPARP